MAFDADKWMENKENKLFEELSSIISEFPRQSQLCIIFEKKSLLNKALCMQIDNS